MKTVTHPLVFLSENFKLSYEDRKWLLKGYEDVPNIRHTIRLLAMLYSPLSVSVKDLKVIYKSARRMAKRHGLEL